MEMSLTPGSPTDEKNVTSENVQEMTESAVSETVGGSTESAESTCPVNKSWFGSDIRKKQLHTFYIFLSCVSLGMVVAIHGPTFLDLIQILNTDIEHGTILFTSGSIGYLCGSLVGGIIFDKYSKELTLFWSTLLGGLFTLAIPWCTPLPFMATVCWLRGCACGALDTGVNALIVKIWGKDVGLYMQTIHFGFGFGGIISPFIAEPFLAPKQDSSPINSIGSPSLFNQSNMNTTSELLTTTEGFNNVTRNLTGIFLANAETNVHTAYLIVGLFASLCAFPYLEMYLSSKAKEKKKAELGETAAEEEIRHIPLTLAVRLLFLVLLGLFYFSYCCVEDTYAGFVMSFVVTHLNWSKTQGTRITSLFWISFSAGRLLAVGIAKFLTPWKMLALDFFFLDISFLVLYVGVESSEWFCWIGTALVAASMASIFPTGMTWMDKRIFKVTGRVASFLLICSASGTMANPPFVGYLFEEFTPMWFIYLLFIQAIFCSVIFIIISCLVVWIHRKRKESLKKGGNFESSNKEPVKGNKLIQNVPKNA